MDVTLILIWVIVGAVAGWLAGIVMKAYWRRDLLTDIIVGVVGGLIGGFLLNALHISGGVNGFNVTSVVTAFVGAVLLLAFLRVLRTA
jgi:uncharacterized membrane protein YeaQ/YmgE (transglycosylase-associated protein family)